MRAVVPGRWGASTWVRLTAVSVVVLALALASTVVLAWRLAAVQGARDLDDLLRRERDVFAARAAPLLGGVDPADTGALAERLRAYLATQPGSDRHLTAITLADGVLLTTRTGPATVVRLLPQGLPTGSPGTVSTVDAGGSRLRVLSVPVAVAGGEAGTFTVYGDLSAVDEQAATVARLGGTAAGIVGVAGAVALAVVARAATAPLRSLRSAADAAGLADLGVRVPEGNGRDDVADLARAFNRMLARLESEAGARTALFAAVSHELRTPVAVARGHLELLGAGAAQDPDASMRLVHDELGRLSRMLDDLLFLAAADSGTRLVTRSVSRAHLVDEIAVRLDGLGLGDIPVTVAEGSEPRGAVVVDPDRIVQAAVNLAVNARRHTPAGTPAEVRIGGRGPALEVTVQDSGPGIPEELRAGVLDPFVRGRTRGSTGLGLAVVRAVAEAHGGSVDVRTGGAGTCVSVHLPG